MSVNNLQELLDRERKTKRIYLELNNFTDLKPTLITVMKYIKEITDIEAIGIRLHDRGDYPYYVYIGFPEHFILKENSLCSRDDYGRRLLKPDGTGYLLDCMCGNVIKGNYKPGLPFFTKNGSFWSNNTTEMLGNVTEEDLLSRTRNYCNSQGYESVALIPIKANGERIGLIQLNDKRVGRFSESLISYVETIGEQIGLAVKNSLDYMNLTKANKAKDKMFSMISHDLRSPFSTLRGYIEFIHDNFDSIERDELKKEISTINRLSDRLANLIDSMLTWGLIQRNKMVLYPQNINLRKILEDEIELIFETARTKDISLKNNLADNIALHTDENALRTILRNLISNAIKFTEAGGEVKIDGSQIRDFTEITIKDTGIGMNEEMMASLFSPNIDNKRPGTNREKGSGLGLMICHELINKMGGDIRVISEIGKGSSFIVSIPSILLSSEQAKDSLISAHG
ncbi:MAG: GAF domain-containing sensor histidine kinase [Promethearchaeota archaeon]